MSTMRLARIQRQEKQYRTVIVLVDEQNQRGLPLWFSNARDLAQQFRMQQSSQQPPLREPLTTDFIVDILQALEGTVEMIKIDVLQEDILFASLQVRDSRGQHSIKARLDDALPLALRLRTPFAVADELLETRGILLSEKGNSPEEQLDALIESTSATVSFQSSKLPISVQLPRSLEFSANFRGWSLLGYPEAPKTYDYHLDTAITYSGKPGLAISLRESEKPANDTYIGSMVMLVHEGFLVDQRRGQRLRMSVYCKAEDVAYAIFSLTIQGPTSEPGTIPRKMYIAENRQQPVEGTHDWKRYELVMDVPADALSIAPGFNMKGKGKIWLADVEFEPVSQDVPISDVRYLPPPTRPQNMHFQQGFAFWLLDGSFPQDYARELITESDGTALVMIRNEAAEPRGSVALVQTLNTYEYRGKRVRLLAEIKGEKIEQQANFFLDRDFMGKDRLERVIQNSTDWQVYQLEMQIPEENTSLKFGISLYGKGLVALKNIRLEQPG